MPGALDRSRVACDLERVEVLLELNGPAIADRPDVDDLCFAFLSLPVKSEVIVAESHNPLAAVALKDLVRVKDELTSCHVPNNRSPDSQPFRPLLKRAP